MCAATGWTVDYVLWGVNYRTLILMLSDAPHYVAGGKKKRRSRGLTAEEESAEIAGFFQSMTS